MNWGAIFSAVIVALVMAVPTMLIIRWSKRRSEQSDQRHVEKEAKRVALQAIERAANEKHLEELLRDTPLMRSAPPESVTKNQRKNETDG